MSERTPFYDQYALQKLYDSFRVNPPQPGEEGPGADYFYELYQRGRNGHHPPGGGEYTFAYAAWLAGKDSNDG